MLAFTLFIISFISIGYYYNDHLQEYIFKLFSPNTNNVVNVPVDNKENYKNIKLFGLNYNNFPILDGATVTQPIRSLIACKALDINCYWDQNDDREMFVYPEYDESNPEQYSIIDKLLNSKTHQAYLNLINNEVDLILVATEPSEDELKEAQKLNVQFDITPIGMDGFIFLLNNSNKVSDLSTKDIINIYTKRITNWKQLGGSDTEIYPFIRNRNSGSQELMDHLVMKDIPMAPFPEERMMSMMGVLIDAVDERPESIGYSLYYYKKAMIDKVRYQSNVKIISIDGVEPNSETINSKQYPHIYYIYAVSRKDLNPNSMEYKIKNWLVSKEGQKLIFESGYVPIINFE